MMRNPRQPMRTAALAVLLAAAVHARAAQVCAHTGDEIEDALAQIEFVGEDTTIRVVGGTYARPLWISLTGQSPLIDMSGGWNSDCSRQDGAATILDGQHAYQILYIDSFGSARANVRISRLSFVNGEVPDSTFGGLPGGLDIWGTSGIVIEQNVFVGNRSDEHTPAALGVSGPISGSLVLRNNLFIGNIGMHAASIHTDAPLAIVAGNTIVANPSNASSTGGLTLDGAASFVVVNNIIWNNDGGDLYLDSTGVEFLYHNDIGALGGVSPDADSEGNLSVAPGFAPGLLNFGLAPDSPLVNRGYDLSATDIGAFDIDGGPRSLGLHVDIGAYESDVLLRDGFEAE
jgi:copper-binding protein NosD